MKKQNLLGWSMGILTGGFFLLLLFILPSYQDPITKFTLEHPLLAPLILIAWRFLGVVIPPIPAGILAFALIPVVGWFWVFLYSEIGLLLGATVAFFLARRFREPVVKRIVPLQEISKWEEKVSEGTQLWTFLLIRLTTGPVMDVISYLAGLTKLRFGVFFLATFLSLLPSAITYYLGEKVYDKVAGESPWITIVFLVALGLGYYFNRDAIKAFIKKNSKKRDL